jgi:hypothetical protein
MKFPLFAILLATMAGSAAFADIAVLHEKGPKAGSLFSNPGLTQSNPSDLKIAMRQADVTIALRPAGGGNLGADVTATFLLEDLDPPSAGTRTYLVAFPVTGLRSRVMSVAGFKVLVDGVEPAIVLRRSISIGYQRVDLRDTPVNGQLDARFSPENEPDFSGTNLADQTTYPDAYAWTQTSAPGRRTTVVVTYAATLRPQGIAYSKSYQPGDDDAEVIPFDDMDVMRWDQKYFFFDYVLISGSTWEGPIGRESIAIRTDPSLGLSANRVTYTLRSPVGLKDGRPQRPPEHPSNALETSFGPDGECVFGITGEKPLDDLLFAVPASSLKLP